MIIKCDFCGNVYDIEKYGKCPNCKAESGNNESVRQQISYQQQAQQYNTFSQMEQDRYKTDKEKYNADIQKFNAEQEYLETQRLKRRIRSERTSQAISKGFSIGCAIPFYLFIAMVVCGMIFGAYTLLNENGFLNGKYKPDTSIVHATEETNQNVSINQPAKLSTYSITCDKFEMVDENPWSVDEGKKFFEVSLIIENTSSETIKFGDEIFCIADGFQCDMVRSPAAVPDTLKSQEILAGAKIKGSVCFEIPEDSQEVLIKCGDFITIKVK